MFFRSLSLLFAMFFLSLFSQVPLSQVYPDPVEPAPFEILTPSTQAICYDIDWSPYAGGENLLFGTKLFERIATYIESKTPLPYSKSMAARFLRLTEFFCVYLPLNYFTSVVQHEVFGHGYRIRDINHGKVHVIGYSFDYPPPYGPGNAATSFRFNPSRMTTTEFTCIAMAGIEAQLILANQVKLQWMERKKIDPRQTILYLVSMYALNLYGSHDTLDADDLEGHDLYEYVQFLNLTYPQSFLSVSSLRSLSWVNLADPFTYYSLFAAFRYLSSGKETSIPMIPIRNYGYLFGAHLGLTPFGPEYFIDNFLVKGKDPIYFYLKAGKHTPNTYFGLGCFVPRLWNLGDVSLGVRFDAWKQPKLLLGEGSSPLTEIDFREPPEDFLLYTKKEQQSTSFGTAASAIAAYRPKPYIGFQMELGYKTKGFLPGYSLYASPVIRASYLATF